MAEIHPGGHEQTDVNIRPIVLFAVVLAVFAVFVHLFLAWLFGVYEANAKRTDPPRSPLESLREPPPVPRLQVSPAVDMGALRVQDAEFLGSYGWVAREAGIVRVPIERAMELVLERGLPVDTGETGEVPTQQTQPAPPAQGEASPPELDEASPPELDESPVATSTVPIGSSPEAGGAP